MRYALLVIMLSFSIVAKAQDHTSEPPKIFKYVEQMPKAPYDLNEYLGANLHYPVFARDHHVQGKVIVKFVVRKTGVIDSCVVTKSVSPELDAEALHVVKNMPPWVPGKSNGELVNVYFNLPINFALADNSKK